MNNNQNSEILDFCCMCATDCFDYSVVVKTKLTETRGYRDGTRELKHQSKTNDNLMWGLLTHGERGREGLSMIKR